MKNSLLAGLYLRFRIAAVILAGLAIPGLVGAARAQFNFVTNNGAITITAYTGAGGTVNIPPSTNGYPVTGIGTAAFSSSSVTNVIIPASVTNLGVAPFRYCSYLVNIAVDPTNQFFSSSNGVCFDKSQGTIVAFPSSISGSYAVPNSVTNIGTGAFYTSLLTSITLPTNVISIGDFAFQYCVNLSGITIPPTVSSLGIVAFGGCPALTSITIPSAVARIGDYAFNACPGLASAYFTGNAPPDDGTIFTNSPVIVYYLSGVAGWGSKFGSAPTALWDSLFQYTTNNLAITITGYLGTNRAVSIPPSLSAFPVTTIGADAFAANSSGINSLTIPDTVTTIGSGAFWGCAITNAFIPASVTNLGSQAFLFCYSLLSFTVDPENSFYSSLNGVIFDKNQDTLVEYPGGLPGSYTVPAGVTNIGTSAFGPSTALTRVLLPASVAGIGSSAFEFGAGLKAVYFTTNAPSGSGDSSIFTGSPRATVYYPAGTTGWGNTFGGAPAVEETAPGQFSYTTNGSSINLTGYNGSGGAVVIPYPFNGYPVGSIGFFAFYANSGAITNLVIPDTVTFIDTGAFAGCGSLAGAVIPDSVTSVGIALFRNCYLLQNISVDPANPFFSSTNGVWFDKSQGTIIEVPPDLSGSYAVPGGVTNIGPGAFYTCLMTNLTLPAGLISIQDFAFQYCFNLPSLAIPAGVASIANSAFAYCNSLTNITIPAGVNIQDYAFQGCSSLATAYIAGNARPDDGTIFQGDANIVYYFPATTGWGATFGSVPAVLWNPRATLFSNAGGQFNFNIAGPTNATVVVLACTNLSHPVWLPVSTTTLNGNGAAFFSDPHSAGSPRRFYRFSSP